jgi:hypothetical protein
MDPEAPKTCGPVDPDPEHWGKPIFFVYFTLGASWSDSELDPDQTNLDPEINHSIS